MNIDKVAPHANSNPAQMGPSARDHKALRSAIATFALLALAMFVFMAKGLARYPLEGTFHHGIKSPVLAVELAGSESEFREVLALEPCRQLESHSLRCRPAIPEDKDKTVDERAVSALRVNTQQDLIFIPLYAGVLIGLAWLLYYGLPGSYRWLVWVAVGSAVLAAGFDYLEDSRIFAALQSASAAQALDQGINGASLFKWRLLAASLVALGIMIRTTRFQDLRPAVKSFWALSFFVVGAALLVAGFRYQMFLGANTAFGLLLFASALGLMGPFFKRFES